MIFYHAIIQGNGHVKGKGIMRHCYMKVFQVHIHPIRTNELSLHFIILHYVIGIVGGGVQLSPLGTVAYCASPG
jgi:hypothetical protein